MIRPSWSRLGPNISVNTIIGLPFITYFQQTIREIENLERYYDTKVQGQGSRAREI